MVHSDICKQEQRAALVSLLFFKDLVRSHRYYYIFKFGGIQLN